MAVRILEENKSWHLGSAWGCNFKSVLKECLTEKWYVSKSLPVQIISVVSAYDRTMTDTEFVSTVVLRYCPLVIEFDGWISHDLAEHLVIENETIIIYVLHWHHRESSYHLMVVICDNWNQIPGKHMVKL